MKNGFPPETGSHSGRVRQVTFSDAGSRGRIIVALTLLIAGAALPCTAWSGMATAASYGIETGRSSILPATMLWAWERNEDLRFIDIRKVGVAFLSRRCLLRGEETIVRPRLQPLRVPSGCILEAVVRIESDVRKPPLLSAGQRDKLVGEVVAASRIPGVKAVQIDFDARLSQRAFYKEMLQRLRSVLPDSMPLSITALASWCMYDNWVSELPVDQVVPMIFRMGVDDGRIRSDIRRRGEFLSSACREAIGICTDENNPEILQGRRIYIFHTKRWSEDVFRRISQEVER